MSSSIYFALKSGVPVSQRCATDKEANAAMRQIREKLLLFAAEDKHSIIDLPDCIVVVEAIEAAWRAHD